MTSNAIIGSYNETEEEKETDAGQEAVLIPDELWNELIESNDKANAGEKHSPEVKIQTVVAYFNKGSVNAASKQMGLSRRTVRSWMETSWWNGVKQHLQKVTDERLIETQQRIAVKAAYELEDRVEHGEYVYDAKGDPVLTEDGTPKRKKMLAKDISLYGMAVPIDKRAVLKGNRSVKPGNNVVDAIRELRTLCHEIGAAKMTETIDQ